MVWNQLTGRSKIKIRCEGDIMGKKNNLVRNASFLMIAAMISKIIGLLYKSPLSSIVGNMGMGYISLAQNAYMILSEISFDTA